KALEGSEGILRTQILIALARNLRRISDHDRLKWLLSHTQTPIDSELCRRLAILCEHDLKDYSASLRFTELQLERLERFGRDSHSYAAWKRRQERLTAKAQRLSL